MSESIEAPKKTPPSYGAKPIRTYTRKPKPVVEPLVSSDSEQSTTSTVSDLSLTPPEPQKPKRNYKKKVAITPPSYGAEPITPPSYDKGSALLNPWSLGSEAEPITEPVEIPSPPTSVGPLPTPETRIRKDTELIDSEPETEPVKLVKEKKPRTEKQKEAFEKMRQARIAKTEELKRLHEIERDQKKLEKEEIKLENLNDKILEKASSIKQRKSKKPTTEKFDILPEPQYVQQIPEKTNKAFLFV